MVATTLRIASYNMLADSYIAAGRYPRTEPALLAPATRLPAVVDRVRGLRADIVCLQEVEAHAFALLDKALSAIGFAGMLALKSNGKPDGCAIFLRGDKVRLTRQDTVHFNDQTEDARQSGHLAQIVTVDTDIGPLRIANTHIKWDRDDKPPGEHVGERQIIELLDLCSPPPDVPVIVCGDFNAAPDSRLVLRMLAARFRDAYAAAPQATCNPNGRAKRIDFLFAAPELNCTAEAIPTVGDGTPLPGPGEPSDHLPLCVLVAAGG